MSDTLEWLSKVKAGKKNTVSFDEREEEDDDDEGLIKGKSSSMVPNLAKRNSKLYSGKDLSGLKVAHDYESFAAGHSEILVLDDTSVLNVDNSEDLLISANMKEDERIKKHREIAKHAKGYSGFKAYEEEASVDEPITLGVRVKKSHILQKYDHSDEFNNEPEAGKCFIIGEVTGQVATPSHEKPASGAIKSHLDTVQSSGAELIEFSKRKASNITNLERERKRAKKLTKALFADEPEMQVDRPELDQPTFILQDEDDFDLQRIIAVSRKDHLTSNPMIVEPTLEPLTIKGKSFDAIFSESIFTTATASNTATPIQKTHDDAVFDKSAKNAENYDEDDEMLSPSAEAHGENTLQNLEPILGEPLVRNGVAATLSLLSMRGISLRPRVFEEEFKSKNQIGADIKLEYFDDFGNQLTSKEAYKELSRRFHGKKAGKSRIEKAIMKREQTNRIEKANATGSVIVSNLRKQQAEAASPYVVLSSTRAQDAASSAAVSTAPSEPVKQRKIFGLQVKQ
jgi:hypothetical protein